DAIWLISPFDVPLQGTFGADGNTALSQDTVFEKKVEWLDENLLTPKSTLATNVATTTFTTIQVAAGDGVKFQTGDVVLIDGEQLQITAYGTTADTFTVTRGFNSTTATTYATGDSVLGLGSALAEGSDPPSARAVDRTDRYNYTQIFGPVAVQVSGTEQVVQKYGLVGTEFDHQVANRIKELAIGFEQAIVNGIPSAGSATVGRTMGGFTNYISSNIDSTTTTLTDSAILTQMQACFDAGGNPDRFVLGSKQKRVVSGLDSSNIRYQQQTDTRGQVVDYYDTDYGRLSVILDRWCLVSQAFLFSRDQATICTLRPMQFEMLAKTGDSTKGQVVAEKSLRFRMQSHSARFSALT
ncbi:MAG: DUF5309 family protein, partial [Patescibacteria group bacterium]|nr:DUF5309 family protein [Patescibacteria group bacterium]